MLCYPPIYLIYNPQQPFSSTSLITLNISTKIQNLVFHRQQDPTFRSMTTRRGYEILGKESATTALLHEGFKRSTSLPSHGSNSSRKMALGSTYGDINLKRNPHKEVYPSPSHHSLLLPSFSPFNISIKLFSKAVIMRNSHYLHHYFWPRSRISQMVLF